VGTFLLVIGAYNAFGSLVLLAFLSKPRAELVLGKWLQVLGEPYDHGAHGPMWIWWSMMTNLGLGIAMVLASRWRSGVEQRDITIVALGVYAIGVFVAAAGLRSPRYRVSGLVACIVLWLAQIGWGAYAVATA
jgi:hypothetical protein